MAYSLHRYGALSFEEHLDSALPMQMMLYGRYVRSLDPLEFRLKSES